MQVQGRARTSTALLLILYWIFSVLTNGACAHRTTACGGVLGPLREILVLSGEVIGDQSKTFPIFSSEIGGTFARPGGAKKRKLSLHTSLEGTSDWIDTGGILPMLSTTLSAMEGFPMEDLSNNLLPLLQTVFAVMLALFLKDGLRWLRRIVQKTPTQLDNQALEFFVNVIGQISENNGIEASFKKRRG